jgi:hypothetical protein
LGYSFDLSCIAGSLEKGLDGATIRNLASEIGTHERRIGSDADSAQVESIGVPASRDGRVVMVIDVGVPDARVSEKLEPVVVEDVCVTTQTRGKFRTSGAVAVVPTVVLAAAVVEDSEQTNDSDVGLCARGEQDAVALDASPVARAVNGMTWRVELSGDQRPEMDKINVHLGIQSKD